MNPIQWLAGALSPFRSDSLKAQERATAIASYRALIELTLSEPIGSKIWKLADKTIANADIESAPYLDEAVQVTREFLSSCTEDTVE